MENLVKHQRVSKSYENYCSLLQVIDTKFQSKIAIRSEESGLVGVIK